MKKKGLVYRATMVFGMAVIGIQLGGELIYSKYFRKDRDKDLKEVISSMPNMCKYSKRKVRIR
jgi:hypothetical protein